MAFGNGVLMRSKRYWAWARDDGSVVHGSVHSAAESVPLLRLPLLRSLVMFAEMLVFTVARHRQNGRRAGRRLVLWLGAYVALSLGLSALLPALHQNGLALNMLVQVLGLVLGITALRLGMGAEVWQYHGAEHKAVNAFEAGVALHDTAQVMRHSRIHERCGTNLVVIVLVLMLAYLPLQNVASGPGRRCAVRGAGRGRGAGAVPPAHAAATGAAHACSAGGGARCAARVHHARAKHGATASGLRRAEPRGGAGGLGRLMRRAGRGVRAGRGAARLAPHRTPAPGPVPPARHTSRVCLRPLHPKRVNAGRAG